MELMNQARRLKRIRKEAAAAGQAAAEAAVPSKKIKFLEQDTGGKGKGKGAAVLGIDSGGGDSDDANADIIVKFSKKEQKARKIAAGKAHSAVEKDATETKMSKKKMKALAKLRDRQEREAKREKLFASLAKHHVDSRAAGLLKSSSTIGSGRETKKQKLSRAIKEERAGLAVTASSDLVVGLESREVGESARARRKRLQREQEERELALMASSSESSGADDDDELAPSGQEGGAKEEAAGAEDAGAEPAAAAVVEADRGGTNGRSHEDESETGNRQHCAEDAVAAAATGEDMISSAPGQGDPAHRRPSFYVTVKRNPEIQQARSKLPMFLQEQQVMEAIGDKDVIVLCGATGCGKSTQLPQFLYEAGYGHAGGVPGMIGCTQPRRVAAITTAKRISKELNMPLGRQVGFQVRYEKRLHKDTKIKVMTDGILLKEIQSDFLLSDYSVIVVDEAHERGINSDVLIGLLSRLVPLRRKGVTKNGRLLPPLKLVIMSATLRVTDFTENAPLFPSPPPVVEVSARQHPVTVHFNRRTPIDTYLQEALKKACKIHRKLPGGGILIFLTGRREIDWMCRNLREELDHRKQRSKQKKRSVPAVRDGPMAAGATPAAAQHEGGSLGAANRGNNPALESNEGESPNKEAFLFGQDDGADSDVENEQEDLECADYDDVIIGADTPQDSHPDTNDSDEEDDDLPEEEYDLDSESDGDEEDCSDIEGGEDAKRTVMLDGESLARGAAGLNGDNTGGAVGCKPHDAGPSASTNDSAVTQSKKTKVTKRPNRVNVLPLYSMLPGPQQLRAFAPAPKGTRMIVVATNVAETSVTIPGIRYVVDTGRVKERVYQKRSGVGSFDIRWASQAAVNQRAGRAGRTGPGHCYRLFSSAVFENQFQPFAPPQMLSSPIEGIMLQMKAMGIPDVRHFPYPMPPDEDDVDRALKTLERLGALTSEDEEVTPLGRQLAALPLAPRFGKMLVLGHQGGCLPYAVSMVAALSVENPIVYDRADATADDSEEEEEEAAAAAADAGESREGKMVGQAHAVRGSAKLEQGEDEHVAGPPIKAGKMAGLKCRRDLWWHPEGDVMALVKAFGAYAFSNGDDNFAAAHGLQPKLMTEMLALAQQLQGIIRMFYPSLASALGPPAGSKAATTAAALGLKAPPTPAQQSLLRQIVLAGLVDQVATRDPEVRGPLTAYKCLAYDRHIYVHQHSCMRKQPADWVCYLELSETSRVYMKGVTPIQPKWLPRVAPSLCHRTAPLDLPPVRFDVESDQLICATGTIVSEGGTDVHEAGLRVATCGRTHSSMSETRCMCVVDMLPQH